MRILQINKFHFPKGGADKHFLDLAKLLESKGHQVARFSMRHPKNLPSQWEKYFVSTVGYTNEYSLWQKIKGVFRMFYSFEARRKINKLLDDFKPNIVHIHNIYHQLSPAILFEIKKRKIPVVMTVHDYKLVSPNYNLFLRGKFYDRCRNGKYYECFLDKYVKNSRLKSFIAVLETYWHNRILKTYQKNVDLYITPSNFAKKILAGEGIDKRRIFVLPHFIPSSPPTSIFRNMEVKENEKGGRDKERKKYALCFGRISREKGADALINIFENLNSVKLYLAGSVEDGLRVNNLKNVKYLGFLKQEELKEYIRHSEFVISGSRLPETFGLVALEAISEGKPFFGFRAGAYPEIIQNGINGYLTEDESDLKNAIRKLLAGEIVFNETGIQREARERYNAENYYKNFMKLLKRLTNLK
jgi:glycosyltransferase involved in cell wall biosynthesis